MAAVERLPLFTIVQIIFHFLWDHWAHCGFFENGVLLIYTLEDISSVANSLLLITSLNKIETPIFLSVVYSLFPKAIFLTFSITGHP